MQYLVIWKEHHEEVEGKDWWEAKKKGQRLVKEKYKVDLPLGLIGSMIKIVKVEGKYSESDIKDLLEDTKEVSYKEKES